ncbi:MAG: glycosyltransferase family 4 protein [Cutibacterium granulosum]|uniref:glycosyltransferase family 4 protein n=1 Tax=Cutibacterium granulosum TaxID=33011 RepID=UPI002B2374BC|nr:glycosyltransferase family 4 protein [Cutibacterium granulosum]MEA5640167.1 glycosyltransferase family 4 protein [Cutibacterium granulosum]MEA5659680.1 glycosyltransferase family 4 protein [Cutibacterium granulosum]
MASGRQPTRCTHSRPARHGPDSRQVPDTPCLHAHSWLRIGLVCPYNFSYPGGVQNHVLGLAGWLRSHGHIVHILGPGHPGRDRLEGFGLPTECFTSSGRTVAVTVNGSVARVGFGVRTAMRVRAWLDAHSFDVLHVHEPMTPSSSLLTLWNADCPLVATFHAATVDTPMIRAARKVTPSSIARIDDAIAVSAAAAATARRCWGVEPTIIGNGVDVSRIRRLSTSAAGTSHDPAGSPWRSGRPTVMFLGRFDESRKGFEHFAAAIDQVRHEFPRLDPVVVGPGVPPHGTGLRFTGPLPDAERDKMLGRADVYVAPNTGGESFGIVLVEALAAGADVVASDLPGFREVLTTRDGVLGALVPVGDADALAAAIGAALQRRARGLGAEQAGVRRARDFDWDVVAPQVVARYLRAIDVRHERSEHRSSWTKRLGWKT